MSEVKTKSNKTNNNKKLVLEALEKSLGVVTEALKSCNLSRTQFYKWMKDDSEFKENVEYLKNVAIDFAESQLYGLIAEKNPTAVIFYLKTKGKDRGYVERVENVNSQKDPFAEMSDDEIKNRLNELRSKRDN
jgi:hypothetical protein